MTWSPNKLWRSSSIFNQWMDAMKMGGGGVLRYNNKHHILLFLKGVEGQREVWMRYGEGGGGVGVK